MRKGLVFFAGGLASLVILGGAQAKMVRYEINGQRYSYNTNNREQSPSFSATMRKPSCFSSWIQPSPTGTFAESTG